MQPTNYKLAVGGHWDDVGRLQFETLLSLGLEPHHKLVDVACGSLRSGRFLVPYLDAKNYTGVDMNGSLIRAARYRVLRKRDLLFKRPVLIQRSMPGPIPEGDIGWIHALFDHIPPEDTQRTISQAAASLPRFFATFFIVDDITQPHTWMHYGSEEGAITTQADFEYWHHDRGFVQEAAEEAGAEVVAYHPYDHPLELSLVEFRSSRSS